MAVELLKIEAYLIQRLKEIAPDVDSSEGSAVRDLLISPMIPILQPLANEIFRIRQAQSLSDPDKLTDADIEAILANMFVTRMKGKKSVGTVRVILRDADSTVIDSGTIFLSTAGLKFYSTAKVVVTEAQILSGEESYYYVDVNVIASEVGSAYNLNAYEISGVVTTNSNVVGARNEESFYNGTDTETNTELIDRAQTSLTQRDLNVKNGILTILPAQFEQIERIDVVGYGDDTMERDIIKGSNLVFEGISIPNTDIGAHCGAMADIYVKVGNTDFAANIQNPQDSGLPKNTIALYTEAQDPSGSAQDDTLYEVEECYSIDKPVIAIEDVIRITNTGVQQQTLVDGKDFHVYVNNSSYSMSMDDRRAIKFCRGTGIVNAIVPAAITPITDISDVIALCKMNSYYSTNAIENEGYGDHLRITTGEDIIDFAKPYSGAGSLSFKGNSSSFAHFDDSSNTSIGKLLEGRDQFTIAFWIRPAMIFDQKDNLKETYMVLENNVQVPYHIYEQGLFCFGDVGSNASHIFDEHAIAIYLSYDDGSDEGKIKVVLGTENILHPTETYSSSFFSKSDAYKWMFISVTYKSSQFQTYGILKAYAQFADGSLGDLPKQVMYQATPFTASGDVKSSLSDRFVYIGRANTDSINSEATLGEDVPSFSYYGHLDDLLIDPFEYKEAQIADLYKGMSSTAFTLSNQIIYKEDGTGALNYAFGTEPPGEKPFNKLRFQVMTGKAKGGIYTCIASDYNNVNESIDVTLRIDVGQSDMSGIVIGDVIAVAPIYPGEEGRLTSIKEGLVYSDKIEYSDNTEFIYGETLSVGDWVPIGVPIRLEYKSSSDIEQIQTFVDSENQRTVVSSNLIKYMNPILVDISTKIKSATGDDTTIQNKIDGLKYFIENVPKGGTLEISDLVNKLYDLGCEYVEQPLSAIIAVRDSEGRLYTETVWDTYTLDGSQTFIADDIVITE